MLSSRHRRLQAVPSASPGSTRSTSSRAAKPYTFAFTVAVKPELELSSYEPVEIKLPAEASDKDVDDQIDAARALHVRGLLGCHEGEADAAISTWP